MRMSNVLTAGVVATLVLVGCGEPIDEGTQAAGSGDTLEPHDEVRDDDQPSEPVEETGSPDASLDFDRQEAQQSAAALLGVSEQDIEESDTVRIIRRGQEHLPGTMDLRPGRMNLELDEDDDGDGYVVTRVVVEVPDGEDELVVD